MATNPHDPDLTTTAAVDELLARGCLTWLDTGDVFDVAGDPQAGEGPLIERACALVSVLVRQDLVTAGDLVDNRHIPWSGRADQVVTRVTEHWRRAGAAALTDAYVWFEPTPSGFARGEQVLERGGLPSYVREYDGHWMVRPDGIKVGLRHTSACGGAVIDVLHPDGALEQVRTREPVEQDVRGQRRVEEPARATSLDAQLDDLLDAQLDDLLARATHDWLSTASVFDAVRSSGMAGGVALIERASRLVAAAVTGRLLEPGRIAFGRFAAWTMEPEEAAQRIAEHWRSLDYRLGDLDFWVWFSATEAGLRRGEAVVARQDGLGSWVSPVRQAWAREAASEAGAHAD